MYSANNDKFGNSTVGVDAVTIHVAAGCSVRAQSGVGPGNWR